MDHEPNGFGARLAALNPWVRGKTMDLMDEKKDKTEDQNLLFDESSVEAEKWYETATEEEKEDIRRRYPDDMDVKD